MSQALHILNGQSSETQTQGGQEAKQRELPGRKIFFSYRAGAGEGIPKSLAVRWEAKLICEVK